MKTKLLLMFLLCFVGNAIAQPSISNPDAINITENSAVLKALISSGSNFSVNAQISSVSAAAVATSPTFGGASSTFGSGNFFFNAINLTPNTTYFFRINAVNLLGSASSPVGTFTTLASPVATAPTISGVSSQLVTASSTNIVYGLNANNAATTSVINYGLSSGALTNQIAGFSASSNTPVSNAITLFGLATNTIYYYQIVATNSAGTTSSAIGSFTAGVQAVIPAIAEYNFNNTLNNINGNTPFSSTNGNINTFGADRNGNANSAINMADGEMNATIASLPVGNAQRTVSFWIRAATINTSDNIVFIYGAGTANNAYGFSFRPTTINNFGWGANDLTGSVTIPSLTWKHIVCTYSSTGQATVYIDGVSVLTGARPTWNTTASAFSLLNFNGLLDDLKIYNYALSQAEVTSLFTNNTLSSQNFNQNNLEVALYPNPANDVLNIDMKNEVQSVEIYNIQGQKVMSVNQKQINVSDLANGMYMIRIQDTENAVSTKKFLKN